MKFHSIYSKGKKKGIYILVSIIVLLIFVNLNNLSNSTLDMSIGEQNADSMSYLNIINDPKVAAIEPNGKPLLVTQYANISKSYTNSILPTNISFTLQQDWTSQNINVSFEGVSQKKDRVINGTFDSESDLNRWKYKSNIPDDYRDLGWQSSGPGGYVGIHIYDNDYVEGDYGYYEQNITIQEELSSGKLAVLSFDYYCGKTPDNFSAYLAIKIGNTEKNVTFDFPTYIQLDSWETLTMVYDPEAFHEYFLPGGNVTVRVGVYSHGENSIGGGVERTKFQMDNIQFDLWTMPNQGSIVGIKDIEFNSNSNSTYVNSTYGEGYYYNATERSYAEKTDIIFTISQNITGIDDFDINTITLTVNLMKSFNSTLNGIDGSSYTNGVSISWQTELIISNPLDSVNNWAEIDKPTDWNITQILDGYDIDLLKNCSGLDIGSAKFTIPSSVFKPGLWKIEATSSNYISEGYFNVNNGANFMNQTSITFGEEYQINMTLNNNTFSPFNTQINCTIEYPNGTIFMEKNKTLVSNNTIFGNFIVCNNMTVGTYQVTLIWTNNQSYLYRDKVGFLQLEFNLWHHTILTAVNSYEERVSGEPFLMKINFTDTDTNIHIEPSVDDFAITYNSTFGEKGSMIYFGSGIYVTDLDLSGLDLGDYYFSFNTSTNYYENQSLKDLIHLKIINQSLVVEVPQTAINVNANSYAIFNVNVTGALSGTLIPGANVTTDWHKDFSVDNHLDGTFTLYLSTSNVPTYGIIETFTVIISANKTNYGSATGSLSITVHPLPSVANVNESIVDVYLNNSFHLKVNYTVEDTSFIISGSTLNVMWASSYNILPVADGFIIHFSTIDLSLDSYSVSFQFNHPGYETAFKSIYVTVNPKPAYEEIFLNQEDKTSDKSITIPWNEPLNVTVLYKDLLTNNFISGAIVELNGSEISETLSQDNMQYSIILSSGELSIGIYFLTITSYKENYDIISSVLKITIEQIEINVETVEINNTLDVYAGDSSLISIILTEEGSGNIIENANVTYSWGFHFGEFEYKGNGVYETKLNIPDSAKGSYTIDIFITINGTQYKSQSMPLSVYVLRRSTPNYLFLGILIALISISGVLGALSIRSYVILPRKRKKSRLFLNTIQVFKDVNNIQQVMLIQRNSGMPFFNKNFSGFGFDDDFLISGFIQAITIFGEQMSNGGSSGDRKRKQKDMYSENIIELNFKLFHVLICDYESVRCLLILREKSSSRLKKQLHLLVEEININFSEKIERIMGEVIDFESDIEILLKKFLSLHYNDPYKLIEDENYLQILQKSKELQTIESRILNVIVSITKLEKTFALNRLIEEIHEKNIDKIYGALHTLIKRRIIVPNHFKSGDSHPLLGVLK